MWHTRGMSEDFIVTQLGPVGNLPVFCWPDIPTNVFARAKHIERIAPDYRGLGTHLLLPRVGRKDALTADAVVGPFVRFVQHRSLRTGAVDCRARGRRVATGGAHHPVFVYRDLAESRWTSNPMNLTSTSSR